MIGSMLSSLRNVLSPQAALELASAHLENACKANDSNNSKMVLTYCDEAEAALSRVRRSKRKAFVSSPHIEDQTLRNDIAATYFQLGKLLDGLGYRKMAEANFVRVEKWGGYKEPVASSPHRDAIASPPVVTTNASLVADLASNLTTGPAVDSFAIRPLPLTQDSRACDTAPLLLNIFVKDMRQPPDINKLPRPEERLQNISQLVYCLNLLQSSRSLLEGTLDQTERNWLNSIEHDTEEKERLKMLATNLLREFAREELKDAKAVAEVVCLVPVLEKDDLQQLLHRLFRGIEQSQLLDFNLLEGLAQLVQGASPGLLNADDLLKILELISTRLKCTHKQSPDYIYQLTLTVSHVLDAMADSNVKDLDREALHTPLADYLHGLNDSTDPYLVYQAAYASQALLYVPDNETPWQATARRTGKVVKGVSGLVSAVKGLDLNQFVEGLKHIQQGLAGASEVFTLAKNAYNDVSTLAKSGKQFLECLNEGLRFSPKSAWYPALRGADVLLRNGQFIEFKRLVYEVPCQRDPAFQLGVCQRLGEIAANTECDDDSRTSAVALLGEMYRNDSVWGQQASIKQLILDILMQLEAPSKSAIPDAETLLRKLEKDGDAKKQALYRSCREAGPSPHPLKVAPSRPSSPSLLDRIQNRPNVESSLRQLKERRLEERGDSVYISPQAKANLQASDDTLFPLMDKVKEFTASDRKVFLLLGDSGAGKSTFNHQLECDLWNSKKKDGQIPLFITLAAIQNPEDELIAKQLRKEGFNDSQIQELKGYHEFILICDGYDESRQTHNLYTSNRLNQRGEWRAQMVISCRSEYLGVDYCDQFQPVDRNRSTEQVLYQEAVIAPFSKDQIKDYIKQFVSGREQLWTAADYLQVLDRIPSLHDMVSNPFLLIMSLDVLPHMVNTGENLSVARITRVALYDRFVEQWLERGKKRLFEKVSDREMESFKNLSDKGFTQKGIEFLKRLAIAIFDNHAGNSVVEYSSFRDQETWKEAFFGQGKEKKLLREACPLSRSGNQYRFIHRSILEYSLARAVFEPQEGGNNGPTTVEPTKPVSRRGSISSIYSFDSEGAVEEVPVTVEQPVLESPLGRKNFVGEPSILRFLVERVKLEPLFKKQLLAAIERSKTEKTELKTARLAAANAITILVRAGIQFIGADLQGIQIPGADLSNGVFDSAQLQGADMRKVSLRDVWLCGATLDEAQMAGVQFGELPFLKAANAVASCIYSPDGMALAIGLDNGDISIYATSTWEITRTLRDHTGRVDAVAYSPRGDQIVSGSHDNTVRLWDIKTGSCSYIFHGHTEEVSSVAYSPNGGQIASGSVDMTVRVWDVESRDCKHILGGNNDFIRDVAYSPKGGEIAAACGDDTVKLWDAETGAIHQMLRCYCGSVQGVAYSPKGDRIASAGHNGAVQLWDTETRDCLSTFSEYIGFLSSVAYSPKGDKIACGSLDNTVRLWDVETGDCSHILRGHNGWVWGVAYSPNGNQIASGSSDGTVRLWDVEAGIRPDSLRDYSNSYWNVVHILAGGQVASGRDDGTVRLWDVETGDRGHTLSGHRYRITSIAYLPQRKQIASGSLDKTVRLWDIETGNCLHTLIDHTTGIQAVAYSPKGDQVASGSTDGTVKLWDIDTGDCRHTLSGHTKRVSSIAYSLKGDQIAIAGEDATVMLWDVETGDRRHILTGHRENVDIVVYSPKGDLIASGGGYDCDLWLWNVESGVCIHTLAGPGQWIQNISFSPAGDQIASVYMDTTVWLWDVDTGHCRHTLSGHSSMVRCTAYSPEGDQIASGSKDNTVRLWDVASGQCQAVIHNPAEVESVVWTTTSDANNLVVGCSDGSVLLWKVTEDDGECCARLSWSTPSDALFLKGASMKNVRGLSQLNRQLINQRGAVCEPTPLESTDANPV